MDAGCVVVARWMGLKALLSKGHPDLSTTYGLSLIHI